MNSNMIYFNGVIYMDMYKTAYFHLFNQISDLIEAFNRCKEREKNWSFPVRKRDKKES